MEFHTLSGNAKTIKMLQSINKAHLQASGGVSHIAILDSVNTCSSKRIVENIVAGVRAKGGIPFEFAVPNYGFLNKINPLTAKYASSFTTQSATTIDAIIKTNMVDGVVIVSDCEVTASGLLMGALKANCPTLVCPVGWNPNFNTEILTQVGKRVSGSSARNIDDMIPTATPIFGYPEEGITASFFSALEGLNLAVSGAGKFHMLSGAHNEIAYKSGEEIIAIAKDIITPKRNLTKDALTKLHDVCANVDALQFIYPLFNENDIKTPHDMAASKLGKQVVLARGTAAADGGYAVAKQGVPTTFKGKAWVYRSVEEADTALSNGTVPAESIIVVHAPEQNVTSLIHTIAGLGMNEEIAVATDGVCDVAECLVLSCCRPSSLDNDDFANIQTGDVLDINLATGRFNTSISAKDMKVRSKKNSPAKQPKYF